MPPQPPSLFDPPGGREPDEATEQDRALIDAYAATGRTLDDLPYTPDFEGLIARVPEPLRRDRAALFRRLHNLRKAARLPRLGRSHAPPPRLDAAHEALLTELVEHAVGALSRRDQLPYTEGFDRLVAAFNDRAALSLGPHDVWRVVAKLAK